MGILDTMKASDEQQTSETLSRLTSTLPAVERQLTQLTKAVVDLTSYVKVMDEVTSDRLDRLLTSQQPERPSTLAPDETTRSRINEIEKTLATIASTLSQSQTVQLPSGESVTRSELDLHAMMTRILQQLEATTASSADLAEAVRLRGTIRIDPERLVTHTVGVLDTRLTKAVAAPVARVEAVISGLETRIAELGCERASQVAQEVDRVVATAEGISVAVRAAERRVDALAARVTWTTFGRLCLALVPFTGVLLILGGLTLAAFHALGIGPLLGWAWASFAAASEWWQKGVIAAATLGAIAAAIWLIAILTRRLGDQFARW